jgi:hypothetical protein
MKISIIAAASTIGLAIALFSAPATAKSVKECNAEYAANKDAIKGAGQKKVDFIAACKAGTEVVPTAAAPAAAAPPPSPAASAGGKTAKECNAEYAANKAAIKAAGKTKKDFVAACRTGGEVIPPAPAASAPPPAAAPAAPAAPAPAPAAAPAPKPVANAPVSASEAQAQANCPTDTVVWVNTRTGVYHFKGTHNYGTTKQGTYMCETAAKAAGDRAAENEKHP